MRDEEIQGVSMAYVEFTQDVLSPPTSWDTAPSGVLPLNLLLCHFRGFYKSLVLQPQTKCVTLPSGDVGLGVGGQSESYSEPMGF